MGATPTQETKVATVEIKPPWWTILIRTPLVRFGSLSLVSLISVIAGIVHFSRLPNGDWNLHFVSPQLAGLVYFLVTITTKFISEQVNPSAIVKSSTSQ